MHRSTLSMFVALSGSLLCSGATFAQVPMGGYAVPLNLAYEAAAEAVRVCEERGYNVSATVVDVAGVPKAVLRGDRATVHTKDSSFAKAYTVVTMGPIFRFDATSKFAETVAKAPPGQVFLNANMTTVGGGYAFKVGNDIVGGLGVAGAPGSEKDEACAKAGIDKVKDRLPKAP